MRHAAWCLNPPLPPSPVLQGRPVDNLGGGGQAYAALGGVTDMSSLVDGVERVAAALPFSAAVGAIQRGERPEGVQRLIAAAAVGGGAGSSKRIGTSPPPLQGGGGPSGGGGGSSDLYVGNPPGPSGSSMPANGGAPLSAAQQYAAKKREALERANSLRAEHAERAAPAAGPKSELDQLHAAFDAKARRR